MRERTGGNHFMCRRQGHQPQALSLCTALTRLVFLAAARCAAQRFFVAATIAALPAALSFRFGFGAAGASGAVSPLAKAHLFLCPAAIFLRAAALILRCGRPVGVIVTASDGAPESIARNSAI